MTVAATHATVGRSTRWEWRAATRTVVAQAVVVLVAYQCYRNVRILAEGDRARAFRNGEALLRFETAIGLDVEQGIQSIVLGSERLIDLFNRVYVFAFWPLVILTLPVLFVTCRGQYRHYRNALFISGGVGLVVFAAFPVAPPRMLDGFVDTVHVFSGSTDFARPGAFTNQYAAMPSFHVGWLVLAGAAAMPAVPWRRLRPLLLAPGAVMTVTVMATANHYLVDAVAGVVVAVGALFVSYRLPSRIAVSEWTRRTLEPVGGVSGLVARAGRGALVGLLALAGGWTSTTFRESVERAGAGARELEPETARRPAVSSRSRQEEQARFDLHDEHPAASSAR